MRDEKCIFCKIANGEIPSATLYEDEDFRVILDLGPASKGHALILPKEHYKDLYHLDDEIAAKAFVLAKRMITKLTEVLGIGGGECTADGKFSLDASRCIGACGMAPILMVNDDVYNHVKAEDVEEILAKYE